MQAKTESRIPGKRDPIVPAPCARIHACRYLVARAHARMHRPHDPWIGQGLREEDEYETRARSTFPVPGTNFRLRSPSEAWQPAETETGKTSREDKSDSSETFKI